MIMIIKLGRRRRKRAILSQPILFNQRAEPVSSQGAFNHLALDPLQLFLEGKFGNDGIIDFRR